MPEPRGDVAPFLAAVAPLRHSMQDLLKASPNRRKTGVPPPSATSIAMAELSEQSKFAGAWGQEPASTAHSIAAAYLATADDHLDALDGLYAAAPQRMFLFAHYTLTRACLEAAGRSVWMSDNRIGMRRRVARGFTEMLHSIEQFKALDKRPEKRKELAAVKANIRAEVDQRGWKLERTKNDDAWSIDEIRPTSGKAIREPFRVAEHRPPAVFTVNLEFDPYQLWQYASAVAHATLFGIMSNMAIERVEVGGQKVAALSTDPAMLARLLAVSGFAYLIAANEYRNLMGWQDLEWLQVAQCALTAIAQATTD